MSPFCPGRTLADCPSGEAESLRLWIVVQEAAGRSRDDVVAELVGRYGEVVLSAPRARGIGLAAYAIPGLAFLAGAALVAVFLRRHTRAAALAPGPPPPAAPLDPELELRLDRELGVR
jgi:cytochrome c-type biogenesis protein CcmH/NrfF